MASEISTKCCKQWCFLEEHRKTGRPACYLPQGSWHGEPLANNEFCPFQFRASKVLVRNLQCWETSSFYFVLFSRSLRYYYIQLDSIIIMTFYYLSCSIWYFIYNYYLLFSIVGLFVFYYLYLYFIIYYCCLLLSINYYYPKIVINCSYYLWFSIA